MKRDVGNLFGSIIAYVDQREKLCMVMLFLIPFVVRLLLITYFRTYEFASEWIAHSDESGPLASSLARGQGFSYEGKPSAWRGVLHPFLLSLVFRVFGIYTVSSAFVNLLLTSIAASLTTVAIYYIARRLFNREVGFISALLWTFHLGSLRYSAWITSEASFVALGVTLSVLCVLRLRDRPHRTLAMDSLLCGLAIGLTALTRPAAVSFVPFVLLWLFWDSWKDRKYVVRQIVVVTIVVIATITPWTIRNYRVFHQFVPVIGTFGVALWVGNNPYIDKWQKIQNPIVTLPKRLAKEQRDYFNSLNEVEQSNFLRHEAIAFIWSNPGTFIAYTLQRIYLFWTAGGRTGAAKALLGRAASVALLIFHLGLVALTIVGIFLSWKRWRALSILLIVLFAYPIPYYLTIASLYRYRFPIEGVMLIFVSYSISYLLHLWRLDAGTAQKRHAVPKRP